MASHQLYVSLLPEFIGEIMSDPYLTQEQEDKLQDLEYELSKRHKKRINRNDIVRYLVDQVTVDNLADLA